MKEKEHTAEKRMTPPKGTSTAPQAPGRWQTRAQRRWRVAEAAAQIAARTGSAGIRSRELSEASGVSVGTMFRLFESVEEALLLSAVSRHSKLQDFLQQEPLGERLTDRLELVLTGIEDRLRRDTNYMAAVIFALQTGRSKALEDAFTYSDAFTGHFLWVLTGHDSQTDPPSALDRMRAEFMRALCLELMVDWSVGRIDLSALRLKLRQAFAILVGPDEEILR